MKVIAKFSQAVGTARVQGIFELLAKQVEDKSVISNVRLGIADRALSKVKEIASTYGRHTVIARYRSDEESNYHQHRFIRAEADPKGNAEVITVTAMPVDESKDKWRLAVKIIADSTYRNILESSSTDLKRN